MMSVNKTYKSRKRELKKSGVVALAGLALVALTVACGPPTDNQTLASWPIESNIRQSTVRIRNIGCGWLSTASAVVIGNNMAITNKHAVAGVEKLDANTWNGDQVALTVTSVSDDSDLAVVKAVGAPDYALGPSVRLGETLQEGDPVIVTGYPHGETLQVGKGHVLGKHISPGNSASNVIWELDVQVAQGNSGGGVIGVDGKLDGVVYAFDTETKAALVVPVSSVKQLLMAPADPSIPPCEERGTHHDVPSTTIDTTIPK